MRFDTGVIGVVDGVVFGRWKSEFFGCGCNGNDDMVVLRNAVVEKGWRGYVLLVF